MTLRWYQKDSCRRYNINKVEFDKYLLKSLIHNRSFRMYSKIYFFRKFRKFSKFSSISFTRRSCLITKFSRSVSRTFKMVRHHVDCLHLVVYCRVWEKLLFNICLSLL